MKNILIATAIMVFAISCGSSDDGGNSGAGGNQDAAVLGLPANNSECTSGTAVNNLQSKVTLQWTAAPNTESYYVYLKNLTTQSTVQFNAGTNTSYEATLQKATPYSWYVSSNKTSGTSVPSETWKFYNAGDAVTNYAPFPADAVAPLMSSWVYGPIVSLQWTGSDIDNDIVNYKIYLDTNANPTTLVGTVTQKTLAGIAITSGATYYWKVVTTDAAGNAAISPVYQFKVY